MREKIAESFSIPVLPILSILLCGCFASNPQSLPWLKSELGDLEIDLIDKSRVEWMHFKDDGSVSVTAGFRDQGLVSPLFSWELDRDGVLRIYGEGREVVYTVHKIELTENRLIANVNGTRSVFEIKNTASELDSK